MKPRFVKIKVKKVDSNGTDEAADKHERKTTKRVLFKIR